jgi:ribosomal protein S18 acetylase RimI-like enzyme
MQIRAATLNDLDRLLQLVKEADEKSYNDTIERLFLTENLTENKSEIYAAVDDKTQEIMGFIQSYHARSTIFKSYLNLSDIYVANKYKEFFVENTLLQYIELIATQFGDARIELQVANHNSGRLRIFGDNRYIKEDFLTYVKHLPDNSAQIQDPNTALTDANEPLKIRQATIQDLNGLLPLLKQYLGFYHVTFDEKIDHDFLVENLTKNKSSLFIALDNDRTIGFVQLYRNRHSEYKEDYYILYDLFVETIHRKKGVGSLLLNAAEKFVRGQKLHYIELQTANDNKEAQSLYIKQGYQLKDITSFYKDILLTELKDSNTASLTVLHATQAQQQIWRDIQIAPKTLKYNMSWCWQINDTVNPVAFVIAWQQLVKSFPSLYTYFKYRNNQLFQIIDPQIAPQCEIKDFGNINEEKIKQLILNKTLHCFDLGQAPLCFAYIFISGRTLHFGMTFHHIALDGHSIQLLMKHYSDLFNYNMNRYMPLQMTNTRLICQYMEHEKKLLLSLENSVAKHFWSDYLANIPKKINFLAEQAVSSHNQRRCVNFNFSCELHTQINVFAKNRNTTLFIIMSTTFAILLYRYTHQKQFIIGYPYGRRPKGFEDLVGYHVNLLPLVINMNSNKSFIKLLEEIGKHRNDIKMQGFDNYPYLEIIKNLKLFPLSNSVLFNVIISPTSFGKLSLSRVTMSEIALDTAENLTDLMLFYEAADLLNCGFEYNTKLFSEKTITQFMKNFEEIILHFMQHPEHSVDQTPLSHISQEQPYVAKV